MAQWRTCKEQVGDAILLFRMGDFYEAFYEDAQIGAKALNLMLTKRQEIPMCGVPVHAVESYIDKLVLAGFRVAIAEQMENPKNVKGIVRREVVRVVSAGTLINSSIVTPKANNYFISIAQVGKFFGLARLELSCLEFLWAEFDSLNDLEEEVLRLQPKEALVSYKFRAAHRDFIERLKSRNISICDQEDSLYHPELVSNRLLKLFGVHSLDCYGLEGHMAPSVAAGALVTYLQDRHLFDLKQIRSLGQFQSDTYMSIDPSTEANLELFEAPRHEATLIYHLDKCSTPMGSRLMNQWLKRPLLSLSEISYRHDAIFEIIKQYKKVPQIEQILRGIGDLERLVVKASMGYATPKDLLHIGTTLSSIDELKYRLGDLCDASAMLLLECNELNPLPDLQKELLETLSDPAPAKLGQGASIKRGVSQELDELKELSTNTKGYLTDYLSKLKEETGIRTLRMGFNRSFGYYIEVSRGQSHLVPETFIRRQTLVNQERYITEELKEFETKVLTAEERIDELEKVIFDQLIAKLQPYGEKLLATSRALGTIDALIALSIVAMDNNWVRPTLLESPSLDIWEGRHPVVEALLSKGSFIPNDTHLDDTDSRLHLITGPNMAGKSTYIRQVALIAILAQMGSYVPAKRVEMGIVDRLFTRIGASDDLSRGQSTFMVEMSETAHILHNVTNNSLVILDEIGRGTSTYDGIAIAWAVAEYLLTLEDRRPKTLFATHFWELTKLQSEIPGAKNYQSAVQESERGVHFLRKIILGGTDKSYGIHVAKLAGLPHRAVERAEEILAHLEENAARKSLFKAPPKKRKGVDTKSQLLLFS